MTQEIFTYPTIKHPRKVFSRIGLALFLYFIIVYACSYAFGFLAFNFFPHFYNSNYFVWVNLVLSQYVIGIPVIRLTLIGLPTYKYAKEKMNFRQLFSAVIICQALSYAGNLLGVTLNEAISAALGKEIDNTVDTLIKNSNLLIVFLVVGIIGPVMEELVFRKFIIDRVRPYGEVLAVFFSGITFGMFHGNFYQLFYSAAIGIVLAYIYIRTKNIFYPIIIHCVFNSISVLAQLLTKYSEDNTLPEIIKILATIGYYMFSAAMLALTILGIIKFIKSVKKVYFIKNIYDIPKSRAFLYSAINAGMILFVITVLAEFAMSIFM